MHIANYAKGNNQQMRASKQNRCYAERKKRPQYLRALAYFSYA